MLNFELLDFEDLLVFLRKGVVGLWVSVALGNGVVGVMILLVGEKCFRF